jgi:acyl-CoA reductase-like NAD-dependent aldehyde dehydrogenase
VPEAQKADVDAAVAAARRAFDEPGGWSSWEPARRAAALDRLATELERRAPQIAERTSLQNGMPISISRQLEGGFPVVVSRYIVDLLRKAPVEQASPHFFGGTTIVRREPMGVAAAILPWNFPEALASLKYAPALAAGCTLVWKPAPETVLDSYVFAEAVKAVEDIPAGVINIVPGGRDVGAYLVQHPGVDRVAFTGSTAAGRQLGEICGRLLRPVTLELGGKSAAIVLDDAKLDLTAIGQELFGATMLNSGQTCYLGTRVLAPRSRYQEVTDLLAAFVTSMTLGDAMDERTQLGPMVSKTHRERVERYIATGKREGARLVVGGGRPKGHDKGWFVEPTIFADVDNASTIAREEIFGPVLSVIPYDGDDDAVRITNDSEYGLGGSVWTSDPERGKAVARRVRTGSFGINRFMPDPGAPIGGVKASGVGRELGPDAIAAYQHTKAIYT